MNPKERLEHYSEYLRENEKSANTIESYVSDLQQFFVFLHKDIKKVTAKDIRSYKENLLKAGRSVKTVNRKLVSIKQFIDFLNEQYRTKITVTIRPEKQQRQEYLEDMLTKEEFERMVKEASKRSDIRAKAIFYTLLYTGGRVSETLQCELKDIEKEYITVRGKGGKYRDIFIPAKLRTVWVEYLGERIKTSDKLFTGQRGAISRQTVHNIIKKYAKATSINAEKAHAHNFRHLFCKMMIDKGYPIDTVADLAGHSDINTTRIYTRKTRRELVDSINDL